MGVVVTVAAQHLKIRQFFPPQSLIRHVVDLHDAPHAAQLAPLTNRSQLGRS